MSISLFARLHRRFGPKSDALSRRELLRATAAASAGLLLSRIPTYGMPGARAGKRIVVIGAGFSGLSCAHELKSAGYDVTVIEARNRLGGRVLSFGDLVEGKNVEGGGELIGSNHPTWVAYKEKFELEFLDVTEDESLESPLVLGGKKLDKEAAEALYKEMEAALSLMNEDAAKINADEPWKSDNAAELDKRATVDWVNALKVSDMAKLGIKAQLTADNGQDIAKQSYLGNLAEVKGGGLEKYWTDSEVFRCKGGNQKLAMRLAEAITADRIVLKLPVTEVQVKENVVVVKCADGRTLEVDDVVLSIPPTVWNKIKFTPDLPAALKPQMGVNLKYLAAVKKRFWKDAGLSPDSLSDGDIGMTWDGTDNQPGDDGAVLNCFSGGPSAEACLRIPKEKRDEVYKTELNKIYSTFGDNFVKSRFMDWPNEQWTMSGYSFPAPGQVTTVGPMLYKGLGHLHFAGEHTCYKFVGYMEGALNSGASLARRIAARDGVIKK